MSLIHLAIVAAVLIVAGVVLVCAAHLPGLRVLVGAEPTGPVPSARDERDVADALHDVADVLVANHVTDGPTPVFTDADRARLDSAWDHGELTQYLAHRAAMRMIRRGEDAERRAER